MLSKGDSGIFISVVACIIFVKNTGAISYVFIKDPGKIYCNVGGMPAIAAGREKAYRHKAVR